MLELWDTIRRSDLHFRPDALFLFGDNMARKGYGGQAKEMRGEPNALGIPTKWRPSNNDDDFFSDSDFNTIRPIIDIVIDKAIAHKGPVIMSKHGIGTGFAQLPIKAPKIYEYLVNRLAEIK